MNGPRRPPRTTLKPDPDLVGRPPVDEDSPTRRRRRPRRHRKPMSRITILCLFVVYGALLGLMVRTTLELAGIR